MRQLRLRYFVIEIKLVLNMLPIFGSVCFSTNRILSEMTILLCTQNDVVLSFHDVIRSAYCALNIELTQPFAILTFDWTF